MTRLNVTPELMDAVRNEGVRTLVYPLVGTTENDKLMQVVMGDDDAWRAYFNNFEKTAIIPMQQRLLLCAVFHQSLRAMYHHVARPSAGRVYTMATPHEDDPAYLRCTLNSLRVLPPTEIAPFLGQKDYYPLLHQYPGAWCVVVDIICNNQELYANSLRKTVDTF